MMALDLDDDGLTRGAEAAPDYAERLARERDFHNERFATENRETQDKFYVAIQDCNTGMDARVRAASKGADVLEYGCATGYHSLELAPVARSVHGIDISDVAVDIATKEAAQRGLANATFSVADAMATSFPDQSFDVIFGSGIIHHLDTERSMREIHRLLRPGGVAIFKEPLGHNVLIEAYRRATPEARTEDEHPLLRGDFTTMRAIFAKVKLDFFGLATLASVPFRNSALARPLYRTLATIDNLLLKLPVLRHQAWYALIELRR